MNVAVLAGELLRALRGRRSQAQFSRQLGYRSNIVQRWETGRCFPTAAQALAAADRVGKKSRAAHAAFLGGDASWLGTAKQATPEGVAAFLRRLRGKLPIQEISGTTGFSRFSVSRWLSGRAQPKLPEFLSLVDAMTFRLLDYLATLIDPEALPSVRARWAHLEAARRAAYDMPWSHAVLRALELASPSAEGQVSFIGRMLGLPRAEVERCLQVLEQANQIERREGIYALTSVQTIDTRRDPDRSRTLKAWWIDVARRKLLEDARGVFAFNLMSISEKDFDRLRELHLSYFHEMQALVAQSEPAERVVLFCTQLVPLHASSRGEIATPRGRQGGEK